SASCAASGVTSSPAHAGLVTMGCVRRGFQNFPGHAHAMTPLSKLFPPHRSGPVDLPSGSFTERLEQARAGAPEPLGELLEGARKYLLTVAEQKLDGELRGKIGASDLVQDTFVEAQRDFVRFRGTTERELLAWLSATLLHRFLNAVRHYRFAQKRALARETSDDAAQEILGGIACGMPTPRTNLMAQEEQRLLKAAFDRLPNTVRDILILRIWDRATFAEIGALCSCSSEAARKRFLRAIEELRSVLEQQGGI